jgi:starvation-inducible DNA-binding protein
MSAKINLIGLDKQQSLSLAVELNSLLATYHIFYQNLRGFHWNIKGKNFFELHAKFEELYTDALEKIDEIAERVLTLGHTPLHSFSDYLENSEIKEVKNVSEGKIAVDNVLQNLSKIIQKERQVLELSGKANDEGTNSLMSDYIKQQEKTIWMLSAWVNEEN